MHSSCRWLNEWQHISEHPPKWQLTQSQVRFCTHNHYPAQAQLQTSAASLTTQAAVPSLQGACIWQRQELRRELRREQQWSRQSTAIWQPKGPGGKSSIQSRTHLGLNSASPDSSVICILLSIMSLEAGKRKSCSKSPTSSSPATSPFVTHHRHLVSASNTKHHTPSDPQAKSFRKFLKVIWNLLVCALSASSVYLSGIHCPPVCKISPLWF